MTGGTRSNSGRKPIKLPMTEIMNEYLSGLSLMDLAAKYGVSDMTIYNRLSEAGIPLRAKNRRYGKKISPRLKDKDKDIAAKVKEYVAMGMDAYTISRMADVSVRDVMQIQRKKK